MAGRQKIAGFGGLYFRIKFPKLNKTAATKMLRRFAGLTIEYSLLTIDAAFGFRRNRWRIYQ